jgi:cephalosporin hydroxylase
VNRSYSEAWYRYLGENAALEWMGVPVVKHPNDLWAYQQIIFESKPDLIIETGTFAGGSALYFGHLCDLLKHGNVISVDLATDKTLPYHDRVEFLAGVSSVSSEAISYVAKRAAGNRCMVILDSAHNADHVFSELSRYSPFVSKGCHLIVEDTNRDGYFLAVGDIEDGEGPLEAVKRFQPTNRGFERDERFDAWGFTQNPSGFFKRVR